MAERHTEMRMDCNKCDKFFFTKLHLRTHQLSEHPENIFKCKLCNKVAPTKELLRKHEQKHIKVVEYKYKCPVVTCQKMFQSKLGQKNHAKQHLEDRYYVMFKKGY